MSFSSSSGRTACLGNFVFLGENTAFTELVVEEEELCLADSTFGTVPKSKSIREIKEDNKGFKKQTHFGRLTFRFISTDILASEKFSKL